MFKFIRFAGLVVMLQLPAFLRAQFVDRAVRAGVDLNYPVVATGHTDATLDPYSVGSASAACDLDSDGWTDLIVTRIGASCLVFINNRDGTYREEAHLRGLDTVADIAGLAVGDLTNSGRPDVVMTPVSGSRYFLFINDGTGHFTEVALTRGADATVTELLHRGQSVTLVDYDRDGYLDISIAEWQVSSNTQNEHHSVLLHNRGRAAPGYFENKTANAGLVQPVNYPLSAGFVNAWGDFDGDGYPDVFIVGDYGTSQLWWNNGDGTFTNGTITSGLSNTAENMGVTLFDFDGDGKIDIFVTAISLTNPANTAGYVSDNKLFRNLGNRRFMETAVMAGVADSGWGWGAQSLDANNDGWPDLVVTNGYVSSSGSFVSAKSDRSKFFLNNGGTFYDGSVTYGITDTGLGRCVAILDYDNDGKEDIFITQSEGHRLLYHNEGSLSTGHWLNLRFTGAASNRDGYGCEVTITAGGRSQTALYNPTNAYLGQREPRLHFGLGASTVVEKISVKWPSGTVQQFVNVAADQTVPVTESGGIATAPLLTTEPANLATPKDNMAVFTVGAQGSPAPVYNWFKDGVRLAGESSATLTIPRVQPSDQGVYMATATNPSGVVTSRGAILTVTANLSAKSTARWWNEALLDGIRKDTPNPPVHARNLYHLSATLWDAFWAYEPNAWALRHEIFIKEALTLPTNETDRLAAQREAMSYAAYTVIKERFARSPGTVATTLGIRWLMQQYGYDPALTDSTGNTPAAVGRRIGLRVLALTLTDGANEANEYKDATGYFSVNPPLVVRNSGSGPKVDPDFWQPLDLVNTITQNGIVLGASVQTFVGSNAKNTQTFALARNFKGFPVDDPGPPPTFHSSTKAKYIAEAAEVLTYASQLSPTDGVMIDISPGKLLNNPLGLNSGLGRATNPITGKAYGPNSVFRGDYARVLAEFWADGPDSETPPGHWNVLFNEVSDHSLATHQFLGTGTALRRLEWDVAGYLVLNGALHDAACAAWTVKWEYDSARPITMIRYLAELGQSSDSSLPSYHVAGLPLIPGQIELITTQTTAAGQRHAHLLGAVGQLAVKSWLGTPVNATLTAGVGWILGVNWLPYQRETFVTPAFPAYISGHSAFSRAGAEVLARYTGSAYFPGGSASYNFAAGRGLGFEAGPLQDVQLQWATYFDAADQAGLSRLYGGIHIATDDFAGRRTGAKVGADAFTKFLQYYNPSIGPQPIVTQQPESMALTSDGTTYFKVIALSSSGLSYQWQRKVAGQTVWNNVVDGGVYHGATTAELIIAAGSGNSAGDSYRVTITNAGSSVTSNAATWSITGRIETTTPPAPTPTPTSSTGSSGDGGGSPSLWFYGFFIATSGFRFRRRKYPLRS